MSGEYTAREPQNKKVRQKGRARREGDDTVGKPRNEHENKRKYEAPFMCTDRQ
jgi:hypothetical protein